MGSRPLRAHQVSRHNCFSMPGLECMQAAERGGDQRRRQQKPYSPLICGDELCKTAARGSLFIGFESQIPRPHFARHRQFSGWGQRVVDAGARLRVRRVPTISGPSRPRRGVASHGPRPLAVAAEGSSNDQSCRQVLWGAANQIRGVVRELFAARHSRSSAGHQPQPWRGGGDHFLPTDSLGVVSVTIIEGAWARHARQ